MKPAHAIPLGAIDHAVPIGDDLRRLAGRGDGHHGVGAPVLFQHGRQIDIEDGVGGKDEAGILDVEVVQVGQRGIGAAGVLAVETHMGIAHAHAECLTIPHDAFNLIAVLLTLGHHHIIVRSLVAAEY